MTDSHPLILKTDIYLNGLVDRASGSFSPPNTPSEGRRMDCSCSRHRKA